MKKWHIELGGLLCAAALVLSACQSAKASEAPSLPEASTEISEASTEGTEALLPTFDIEVRSKAFVEAFLTADDQALFERFSYEDAMGKQFTAESVAPIRENIEAMAGAFEEIYGYRHEQAQGYEIAYLGVQHAQKKLVYSVAFTKSGEIGGFHFKEIPDDDKSFEPTVSEGEAVIFGTEAYPIHGQLELPKSGEGPYPAVILVHGSGPHDRHERIGPNAPFDDIAKAFTDKGIAVLRYDKRTYTHAQKLIEEGTANTLTVFDEVVEDAQFAFEVLSERLEIDPKRIFVLGHSLGGNQAPRIAERCERLAGIIVLAGNVTPLQRLIPEQYEYIMGLDGGLDDAEKAQLGAVQNAVRLIESKELSTIADAQQTLGIPAEYWKDIRGYDPAALAAQLDIPILIVQGGRDYQVPARELELWKEKLGDAATYKLYPDLNHLFMKGEGPSTPDEYAVKGNVSAEMLEDVAAWIVLH